MSGYENIMGGKLRLKGKALDVKAGGLKKKKQKLYDQISETNVNDVSSGISNEDIRTQDDEDEEANKAFSSEGGGTAAASGATSTYEDHHLTPAEKRYMEQKEKIDVHRLAKIANKSHRDRIQDFNQYLANMSEHYDIPKVGPG